MNMHKYQKPFFISLAFLALILVVGVLIITQARKPPQSSVQTGLMDIDKVSAEIPSGYSAEMVLSDGHLTVYRPDDFIILFPAGALRENFNVELSLREPTILEAANDNNWKHVIVVNVELIDMEQIPLEKPEFPVPIEACFVLNNDLLQVYLENPDLLRVEHFNDNISPARWEVLPGKVYITRRLICGKSSTASLFALSTFSTALVPVTGPTEPYTP